MNILKRIISFNPVVPILKSSYTEDPMPIPYTEELSTRAKPVYYYYGVDALKNPITFIKA
jgi:hypothetical protein